MTATTAFCSKEKHKLFSRFFELVYRRADALVPNSYDRDVYLFIADRSLPFGKLSKDIPDRWFLDGVTGKGNTRGHRTGLSMKRSQLYKSRKALKDQGLIRDQKVGRCKRYAIVLELVWPLLSAEERELFAPLLALVDPDWQADDQAERVHSVDVQQVHSMDPRTEKRASSEEKRSARILAPVAEPEASPFSDKEEGASAPVEHSLAAAPAVAVRPAPPTATPPTAKTDTVAKRDRLPPEQWARTMFDRFAAVARATWPEMGCLDAPTAKQRGQLRNMSRGWTHPRITFLDFLEWSAANWRGVWASKMAHVRTNDPAFQFMDHPDIGTLIYFHKAFRDSYDRRASQRIRAGLTRRDNLLREFMFKGFSHADAEAEADEVLAKEKKREDLDKRAREINDAARRLEAEKQMPEYRLAVARIRSGKDPEATWVKPVALAKPGPKPTFKYANEEGKPLPPLPEWKDDPEEGPELNAGPWTEQLPSRDPAGVEGHV